HPDKPRVQLTFDASGQINDAHDIKVGMTNVSLFAYIADGHNGLRVVQLTSPETTPGNYGFSPTPNPELIATFKTNGPAMAISKGIDRDRAVDESGNQIAVFGRRGARPLNLDEMERMYKIDGKVFMVPEIKSADDIRSFYGVPREVETAENAAGDDERDSLGAGQQQTSADGATAPSVSATPSRTRQPHWMDFLTFGFPILPLGLVWCFKLRGGMESKRSRRIRP
ncbi:MAG TPA: hypothetical protein VI756_13490, partial [Blastocatellia bacterium]